MKIKNMNEVLFKLGYFGISKSYDGRYPTAHNGSPPYVAPEVLMCEEYDAMADMWALGIVFYELLTKTFPFDSLDQVLYNKPKKLPHWVDSDTREILSWLLHKNPAKRKISLDIIGEVMAKYPQYQEKRNFYPPHIALMSA